MQNALLLRVSALWKGSAVSLMDDAREAQLSKHALCCCARFAPQRCFVSVIRFCPVLCLLHPGAPACCKET